MVLSPVGVVDQYVILTLQQIRWQVVNPTHSLHVGLTGQQEEVTCLLFQMVILTFSDGDSHVLEREDLIHPSGDVVPKPLIMRCLRISISGFNNPVPAVTDITEGLHDLFPFVVTLHQIHTETCPEALIIALAAAELLDVDHGDPFPEDADPLLWPSVVEDVSDVEIPADLRSTELIHILYGFHRTEQKMIPHILDSYSHSKLLGKRDHFADFKL